MINPRTFNKMLVLSAIFMLAIVGEVRPSEFPQHPAAIESYPQGSYIGLPPPLTYSYLSSASQQYYASPSSVEGEIKGGVKGGSREIQAPLKDQAFPLPSYGGANYFAQPTLAYVFIRPLQQAHSPQFPEALELSQQREVYPMQQASLAEGETFEPPAPVVDDVVAVKTGKLLKLKKSLGRLASKFYIGSHEVAPPSAPIQQQKLVQQEEKLHVKGPIEQQQQLQQADIKLAPEISVHQEAKVPAKEAPKEVASAASGPSTSSNPDDGFKRISN